MKGISIFLSFILIGSLLSTLSAEPAQDGTLPVPESSITEDSIRLLIQELGAENQNDRDAAQKKIESLGKKALPFLKKIPSPDDPEVKERLNNLILLIENKVDHADSPQGDKGAQILKTFYEASEDEREEMLFDILEKYLLSPLQLKQLILWQLQKSPDSLSPWQWERINFILNYETYNCVQNKKTDELIPLWKDLSFQPTVRHKLANIFHTLKKSPDETDFSPEDKSLIEAEIALLEQNWPLAREKNTGLDPDILFYASLGEKKTLPLLEFFLNAKNEQLAQIKESFWDEHIIPTLDYFIAQENKDPSAQDKALKNLKNLKTPSYLLFQSYFLCGDSDLIHTKLKSAFNKKNFTNAALEAHTWQLATLLPTVDLRKVLPLETLTPEAILQFSQSILPAKKAKSPNQSYQPKKESIYTFVLLTSLALYLEGKGYEDLILPTILTHIEMEPENSALPLLSNYLLFFNRHKLNLSVYTIIKKLEDTQYKNMDSVRYMSMDNERLEALQQIFGSGQKLSDLYHQYHLLVTPSYGNKEEKEKTLLTLLDQVSKNINQASFKKSLEKAFLPLDVLNEDIVKNIILPSVEILKTSLIPTNTSDMVNLTRFITAFAPNQVKQNYINDFKARLHIENMMSVKACIATLQKNINDAETAQTEQDALLLAESGRLVRLLNTWLHTAPHETINLESVLPFLAQPTLDTQSLDINSIPVTEELLHPYLLSAEIEKGNTENLLFLTQIIANAHNISSPYSLNQHNLKLLSKSQGIRYITLARQSKNTQEQSELLELAKKTLLPYHPTLYFKETARYFPDRKTTWEKEKETYFTDKEVELKRWPQNLRDKIRYIKTAHETKSHLDQAKAYQSEIDATIDKTR